MIFFLGGYYILPQKEPHSGLWVHYGRLVLFVIPTIREYIVHKGQPKGVEVPDI